MIIITIMIVNVIVIMIIIIIMIDDYNYDWWWLWSKMIMIVIMTIIIIMIDDYDYDLIWLLWLTIDDFYTGPPRFDRPNKLSLLTLCNKTVFFPLFSIIVILSFLYCFKLEFEQLKILAILVIVA